MKINEVYNWLDGLAPFKTAEKWDNSGFLAGNPDEELTGAVFALDITLPVIKEAKENGCNLIVSHHPVIFDPIKSVCAGSVAYELTVSGISAICAHTNLDMAAGGVNDVLIERLGLIPTERLLETVGNKPFYQVYVFAPRAQAEEVYAAMCKAGGGILGDYADCAFMSDGVGRFLPLEKAKPFLGAVGVPEKAAEVRIEMLVAPSKLKAVISGMKKAHPYEEPAFGISENHALYEETGFGRICELPEELTPSAFAEKIKTALGCKALRFVDTKKPLKTAAVCSGSGGSFIEAAIEMGADALIAGDIKHDQLIEALNRGLAVFDAGHYHTEYPVIPVLLEKFRSAFPDIPAKEAVKGEDPASYIL